MTDSIFGDVISAYTRAQAIEDGTLVDVTKEASTEEMMGGFRIPVAVTAAVWATIEAIPPSLQGIADVRGRLHDVLWMAACAARRASDGQSRVGYTVILPSKGTRTRNRVLAVDIGPGDAGEPVVTIGYPEDF
jgi:hypothetical protein